MNYWLLKTEPTSYSWADLVRDKKTSWTGVRNYQARNYLRDALKKGDRAFIYHSSSDPKGVFGVAEVVREGYPDPTQFDKKDEHYDPESSPDDPRWFTVDVRAVEPIHPPVTLDAMRAAPGLAKMALLRPGQRLSVQPVAEAEWKIVLALAGKRSR